MKSTLFSALLACALFATPKAQAQEFVNLTPHPMQMQVNKGVYRLPSQFTIGGTQLPDSIQREARKFVADFNKSVAGSTASFIKNGQSNALTLVHNKTLFAELGQEGYQLSVTAEGIRLESATTAGFFYGFTSLKKMLPASVAAGVKDEKVSNYALPLVEIKDKPRFAYRGFMLDVARHFFSVQEIKKMLDLMAIYKMNKFHFHLTEDQGWRWEVKKYPKLTQVGAVAPNCYVTSMEHGAYWTNEKYGPYFYTREELKDIVAYAAARHIEVIPEIDMPGHFTAAMVAYPEFSSYPKEMKREIPSWGGIYTDVLNVANPKAVRFVKDILDELMEIFPSKYVHIGGDECPTTAWEQNAECQAMYKKLGLTSYRQLQTHFVAEITDYLKRKGRKIAVWNETLTEKGADLDMMKQTGATVFSWNPARKGVQIADSLGLPSIYTVYGPYYINRAPRKDSWMKTLPGNGSDHLKTTYNEQPPALKHSLGVQGTFWTEHVATADVMEFLALPRLIAVGEAGWTPQNKKNFSSFVQRMRADTAMLNYGGYHYDREYLTETRPTVAAPQTLPQRGQVYVVRNTVAQHAGTMLSDAADQGQLLHTRGIASSNSAPQLHNGWEVVEVSPFQTLGGTLTLQLRNADTHRFIGTPAPKKVERYGYPVAMTQQPQTLVLAYAPKTQDFTLATAGKFLFPVSPTADNYAGQVSSGSGVGGDNAVRPQGTGWQLIPAVRVTYVCVDAKGKSLGTFSEYLPTDAQQVNVPSIKGYHLKGAAPAFSAASSHQSYTLTFQKAK